MMEDTTNTKTLSDCIFNTFNTPDGKTTLAWLLHQCGFFESDPEKIKPELLALGHKLLNTGHMGIMGDAGAFVTAVLNSYFKEGTL